MRARRTLPAVGALMLSALLTMVGATPARAADMPSTPDTPTVWRGIGQVDLNWGYASSAGLPITYVASATPGGASCTTSMPYCTVTGLTNGTAYTFHVVARTADGDSAPTAESRPVTPQSDIDAPIIGRSTFSPKGLGDAGGDVTIDVHVNDDTSGVAEAPSFALHGAAGRVITLTSRRVSGDDRDGVYEASTTLPAEPGAVWWLDVLPVQDRIGNASPAQAGLASIALGYPDAPTDVATTLLHDRVVRVSWTPPQDDGGHWISDYAVRWVGVDGSDERRGTRGLTFLDIDLGDWPETDPPRFTVAAINAAGISPESAAGGTTLVPAALPGAPRLLGLSGTGRATAVDFLPAEHTGGATILEYRATAEPDGRICTAAPSAQMSCRFDDLEPYVHYSVQVVAVTATGVGPASYELQFEGVDVPLAPPAVRLHANARGDLQVGWDAADGQNRDLNAYDVVLTDPSGRTLVKTVSGTSRAVVFDRLRHDIAYRAAVRAVSLLGNGPYRVAPSPVRAPKPGAAPRRMAAPAVAASGAHALVVRWNAAAVGDGTAVKGYTVRVRRGASVTAVERLPATARTVVIRGLHAAVVYRVTVSARNAAKASPESGPTDATTRRR